MSFCIWSDALSPQNSICPVPTLSCSANITYYGTTIQDIDIQLFAIFQAHILQCNAMKDSSIICMR